MEIEPTKKDRREDEAFQEVSCTNAVAFSISTWCSMKCPKCSLAMPALARNRTARHITMLELDYLIPLLQGLKQIHITGGEPTVHPEFSLVVQRIAFECQPQHYTIESNGFKVLEYIEVLDSLFDRVFITQYLGNSIYAKSPDNTSIIMEAKKRLGNKLIIEPPIEHALEHGENPSKQVCTKYLNPGLPAGLFNGKFYHCCVEPGIEEKFGIVLGVQADENWREEVAKRKPCCELCLYAGT